MKFSLKLVVFTLELLMCVQETREHVGRSPFLLSLKVSYIYLDAMAQTPVHEQQSCFESTPPFSRGEAF